MHLYSKHRSATVANRTTAGQRKVANEIDPILRQLAEIPRDLRRAEPAFRTRVERHRHDTGRYTIRRTARHLRVSGIRSGLLLLPKAASILTGVHPPPGHQSPKMTPTGSSSPGGRYFLAGTIFSRLRTSVPQTPGRQAAVHQTDAGLRGFATAAWPRPMPINDR